jgi:Na+/melibiose symporter-like transporter
MFVRKLAGALAVWLALTLLGALGYDPHQPPSPATLTATRWLTSIAPAAFLVLAAWIAHGYPLTRARHAEIRAALERRAS